MTDDVSIFAVLPHMHLTGVHMTTTAGIGDSGLATLLDTDFHFTDQNYKVLDPPVQLPKGSEVHVECDYQNKGQNTLGFGESTTGNEMCITFAYRYPALEASASVNTTYGFPLDRGTCFDGL